MKHPLFASLCFLSASLGAFGEIERTIDKTFEVKEGQRLRIDTCSGPIEVDSSPESKVVIQLRQKIDADNDAEADELLSKIKFSFETDGEGVLAKAEHLSKTSNWGIWNGRERVKLTWTIKVPKAFNVDLDTAGGRIVVGNLKGNVKADTSGGPIDLGDVDGEVFADTSGGTIKVRSVTGKANLDTSGGGIHVGTAKGPLHADTSGGNISVKHAEHQVKADTSGGGIDVAFFGQFKGPSSLDTSGGGITVSVDPDASFQLEADASGGSVTCDLPIVIRGSADRNSMRGKVNDGGPVLHAETSGGSIRIRKN